MRVFRYDPDDGEKRRALRCDTAVLYMMWYTTAKHAIQGLDTISGRRAHPHPPGNRQDRTWSARE